MATQIVFYPTNRPVILKVGVQGPPGGGAPGSGDRSYVHPQPVAASVWVVNHNLNKYPSVTVLDTAGDEVEGEVRHISLNQTTLTFSSAFAGTASFN